MASKVQQEEKPNRWQWILFVIVIPSLFAAFFLLLIIKVAGIDVAAETKQWTANVPLISEWIDWKKKERARLTFRRWAISIFFPSLETCYFSSHLSVTVLRM